MLKTKLPENHPIQVMISGPQDWIAEVGAGPFAARIVHWLVDTCGELIQVCFAFAESKNYKGANYTYFLASPSIVGEQFKANLLRGSKVMCNAIYVPEEHVNSADLYTWKHWWHGGLTLICSLVGMEPKSFQFPIDETFPRTYSIREITEMPDDRSIKRYSMPEGEEIDGYNYYGSLMEIQPENGEPWIGAFSLGLSGISGVFTTPNPDCFCVVKEGQGCLVSASDPSKVEEIAVWYINEVRPVPGHKLMVFACLYDVAIYDENGLRWQEHIQVGDDAKVLDISDRAVRFSYWEYGGGKNGILSVDIETGKCIYTR
jgi:hypothetical protein